MGKSSSVDLERAAMLTHVNRMQDERAIGLDFNADWIDGALRLYSAVGGSPQDILRAIAAADGDLGAAQRALISPDQPVALPGVGSSQEQDLRAELANCGLKELRKRAADLGVSDTSLEDALDADVPKQAVTELIVQVMAIPDDAGPSREELMGMRLSALRKLALDHGIPEDFTEDALDQDSPKEALVDLIDSFDSTASTFAPPVAPAPAPAPVPAPAPYRAPAPAPAPAPTPAGALDVTAEVSMAPATLAAGEFQGLE